MKPIKMFGLAALAALLAMAFVGASSASAEKTALCSGDGSGCGVSHVHETTLSGAKGKLLTSIVNVECDVLFLGDTTEESGAPLVIEGTFTYTNCGSCTVEEVGGGVEIKVLKLGHETSDVTGEGEVHVNCSGLNCTYNGEGLLGTGKGPLLSSETNGSVTLTEQTAKKVSGLFCPSTSKLDITTTPLIATYLGTNPAPLLMACIKVERLTGKGLYKKDNGNGECTEMTGTNTRDGEYELAEVKPTLAVGEMACAVVSAGFLLQTNSARTLCTVDDHPNRLGIYELGKISSLQ